MAAYEYDLIVIGAGSGGVRAARMFRDSRLGPIGGGTSEILREIIAKMVIDKKEYKPAAK